jgi:hypothetical protein
MLILSVWRCCCLSSRQFLLSFSSPIAIGKMVPITADLEKSLGMNDRHGAR